MSDSKQRWPLADATVVANEIIGWMLPSVAHILIVGSVRRERPDCGDVELLYIPKVQLGQDPADMFASKEFNMADKVIDAMICEGVLAKRLNVKGQEIFGQKNKLMRHVRTGMPVDLFSTSAENWWASLVIRTGSRDTNLRLTTGAQALGRTLNAYGSGVTILRDQEIDGRTYLAGESIAATSEREVFELCGVPFLEVEDR